MNVGADRVLHLGGGGGGGGSSGGVTVVGNSGTNPGGNLAAFTVGTASIGPVNGWTVNDHQINGGFGTTITGSVANFGSGSINSIVGTSGTYGTFTLNNIIFGGGSANIQTDGSGNITVNSITWTFTGPLNLHANLNINFGQLGFFTGASMILPTIDSTGGGSDGQIGFDPNVPGVFAFYSGVWNQL